MADGVSVTVKGLDELYAQLDNMGQEFAARALVSAAYTANRPMVQAVRNQIEADGLVDTGLLEKSITRKKIIYAKDGRIVIITGVNKRTKGVDHHNRPRIPYRYANVLQPKYKFLTEGFESAKQEVVDKFVSALKAKIKKYEKSG